LKQKQRLTEEEQKRRVKQRTDNAEREGDNSRSRNFWHGHRCMLNKTINTLHHSRKRRLFGFLVAKVHVRSSPSPFGEESVRVAVLSVSQLLP